MCYVQEPYHQTQNTHSQCWKWSWEGQPLKEKQAYRDGAGSLEKSTMMERRNARKIKDLTEIEIKWPACILLWAPQGSIIHEGNSTGDSRAQEPVLRLRILVPKAGKRLPSQLLITCCFLFLLHLMFFHGWSFWSVIFFCSSHFQVNSCLWSPCIVYVTGRPWVTVHEGQVL